MVWDHRRGGAGAQEKEAWTSGRRVADIDGFGGTARAVLDHQ